MPNNIGGDRFSQPLHRVISSLAVKYWRAIIGFTNPTARTLSQLFQPFSLKAVMVLFSWVILACAYV